MQQARNHRFHVFCQNIGDQQMMRFSQLDTVAIAMSRTNSQAALESCFFRSDEVSSGFPATALQRGFLVCTVRSKQALFKGLGDKRSSFYACSLVQVEGAVLWHQKTAYRQSCRYDAAAPELSSSCLCVFHLFRLNEFESMAAVMLSATRHRISSHACRSQSITLTVCAGFLRNMRRGLA